MRQYSKDASSRSQCEQQIRSFSGDYSYIIEYHTELDANLTAAFSRINFVPTVYDEVEFFKNAIDYPFQKRKNELPRVHNDLASPTTTIYSHKILLRKNTVCYDTQW